MDELSLNSIKVLENDKVILNHSALKQIIGYMRLQSEAINTLSSRVSELTRVQNNHATEITANSKNIKTLATALKGVYSND